LQPLQRQQAASHWQVSAAGQVAARQQRTGTLLPTFDWQPALQQVEPVLLLHC
jgi:hypothetical protein